MENGNNTCRSFTEQVVNIKILKESKLLIETGKHLTASLPYGIDLSSFVSLYFPLCFLP